MIVSDSLSFRPYLRAFPSVLVALLLVLIGGGVSTNVALSQESDPEKTPNRQGVPDGPAESQEDVSRRVNRLVDALRSDQFAVREHASEQLFSLGHDVLPILRATRRGGDDTEQNDRLDRIIGALAEQDLESRIHSFLKGGEADLENWPEVKKWFGDSPRVRELFVDLYREHPGLVAVLGGTPQQLSIGLARVRRRLIERGVGPRETPQRIDLIALLLPMVEPKFQAGPQYDMIVASLLQYYPANDFRGDLVLGQPFAELVTRWMVKSDLSVREQVLRLAMQWKMKTGLKLALETLRLNPDPVLLCRCMQTIARQGDREQAALLAKYLDDPTVVYRRRHRSIEGVYGSGVQVRDVAAASIAFLSSVPVTEIGFAEPAEHEIFGIIFEELVVPMKKIADPADDDSEEKDEGKETEQDDEADPRDPFRFGRLTPTREQMQELSEQARRRDAARLEIRARALELVPAELVPGPNAPVEKS